MRRNGFSRFIPGRPAAAILLAASFFLVHCERTRELEITSVTPAEQFVGDPVMVEVSGHAFDAKARVWFGLVEARQSIVVGPDKIIALPPRQVFAGPCDVKVQNPDGKSALSKAAIKFESRLAVTSAEPSFKPLKLEGLSARLIGQNFMEGARVFFGQAESQGVEYKSPSLLSAPVPELEKGMYDLKVVNPDGSEAFLYDGFQVIDDAAKTPIQAMEEKAKAYGVEGGGVDMADSGAAFADVNRDGYMDLLVISQSSDYLFLGSKSGSFKRLEAESGLLQGKLSYGGYFGDYDNDGLPDLFITGQPGRLYHNEGAGKFKEVTEAMGFNPPPKVWAAAWADFDRDGRLDIFLGHTKGDDMLYKNKGDSFELFAPETFQKDTSYDNPQPTVFSAAWGDYDKDGFIDLFVGIRGQPSIIFKNEGGSSFKSVATELGIDFVVQESAGNKTYKPDFGVSWADYDNDGWLDIFSASGIGGADLYKNREGKGFINATRGTRVSFSQSTISEGWGDFDNDGFQDLAVSDNLTNVRVYRNGGDGSFLDVSRELGIADTNTAPFACVWADVNDDGALDLYVTEFQTANRLYVNKVYPGRHYLKVKLEGKKDNSTAVGAMVTVQAGGHTMTRQVSGGEGYSSQPPPWLHFGLGEAAKADKVTVLWPSGGKTTLEQVPADQTLTVIQEDADETLEVPPENEK